MLPVISAKEAIKVLENFGFMMAYPGRNARLGVRACYRGTRRTIIRGLPAHLKNYDCVS